MCGIVGIIGSESVSVDIVRCLERLEYRGYDSAGMALQEAGEVYVYKGVGYVKDVFREYPMSSACIGIGHTRWATHGGVTDSNAHPHIDCTGNIAIVHNGIIDNYQLLKEDLITRGHRFMSETDSEVIAHLIEESNLPLVEAMYYVAERITGQYAIAAMDNKFGWIVAMRRGNPLVIGRTNDEKIYLSSDPVAFPPEVDKIQLIENNELVVFSSNRVLIFNLSTRDAISRNLMPYHNDLVLDIDTCRMDAEMLEQPEVILNIASTNKDLYIDAAMEVLRHQQVVLTGCGSSKHAGLVGRYTISSIANRLCELIVSSEFEYYASSIDKRTMVIVLSQSGETNDVLRAVEVAHQQGSKVLSLVNAPQSSLVRVSDYILPLCCGPEVSVASTKAFTAQLCVLYLLSFAMQNRFEDGVSQLRELAHTLKDEVTLYKTKLQTLADKIRGVPSMYYIGRGINYPLACEGALKMKEISYIQAESFSAGELKHGPIALIQKGTPVVGVCPNDDTYADTVANLHEAKARGALAIGISDKQNEIFDYWIPMPKVNPLFYPVVATLPLHILAYLVSIGKGINPDRPRNLAKSVTVK